MFSDYRPDDVVQVDKELLKELTREELAVLVVLMSDSSSKRLVLTDLKKVAYRLNYLPLSTRKRQVLEKAIKSLVEKDLIGVLFPLGEDDFRNVNTMVEVEILHEAIKPFIQYLDKELDLIAENTNIMTKIDLKLLGALASYTNLRTNVAFPSRDRLIEDIGEDVDTDTISAAIQRLKEMGLITVDKKNKINTSEIYNSYTLVLDRYKHARATR